jgi:ATP-dependent Clp endopeptidase proteolytic subunit ClpP
MADIYIYDVIGRGFFEDGATAEKLRDELAAAKGDAVTVHINSPGGDVFEGLAMRTLLSQHKAGVTVKIDGVAASAASVVALGGGSIEMAEGSMMMIHDPWTLTVGNAADHEKTAETLNKVADNLADLYAAKSGKSRDETRDSMRAETWLTAQEAIDYGLADKLSDTKVAAYKIPEAFGYRNVPTTEAKPNAGKLSADARRRKIDLTRKQISVH